MKKGRSRRNVLLLEWGALPSEPVADCAAVGMQWALPRVFGVGSWYSD